MQTPFDAVPDGFAGAIASLDPIPLPVPQNDAIGVGVDWSVSIAEVTQLSEQLHAHPTALALEPLAPVPAPVWAVDLIADAAVDETQLAQAWQLAMGQILSALANRSEILALFAAETPELIYAALAAPITVELLPVGVLGAKGAFAAAQSTIYLAEDWVAGQSVAAIATVMIEEIGHWLDSQLNATDTAGDEGAVFAALVQQQSLSAEQWSALSAEDDTATIFWQGQTIAIEKADLGEFTVGASGQISVDFLYDNGAYAGELAVFDLAGMDAFAVGSPDYIAEAARRALSNSAQGHVVISDITSGAQRSGRLSEADRNQGAAAPTRTVSLTAGSTFAFMLVPNGSVQALLSNPTNASLRPLFSLAAANPNGATHIAQVTNDVFALEDLRFDQGSDADYNDVVFRVQGATGKAAALSAVAAADWSTLAEVQTLVNSASLSPSLMGTPVVTSFDRDGKLLSAASGLPQSSIGADVPKITTAAGITIYSGYEQATPINQNPVLRAYDSAGNPLWARADYETGGPDGRSIGLAEVNGNLYAVFTVDGADGDPSKDLRRAATDVETSWLRSYGRGGGPKASVIALIDPNTGDLLRTAYLTSILSNGNSNSLLVTDMAVNSSGNLVITADAFFSPRDVDGTALTRVTTAGSPFIYMVELTPDLKRVVSTGSVGWV